MAQSKRTAPHTLNTLYSMSLSHPGELSGPHYVEDRVLAVPVPSWVHPSRRSHLPSSSLVHLLDMARSPAVPERFREMVIGLLCRLFPRPVARERWPRVGESVRDRATERETDEREEMVAAVAAALCLVQPGSSQVRAFEADLRQQLNNAVTEDFLGPRWREVHERLEEDAVAAGAEEDFLRALVVRDCAAALDKLADSLSPRERELLAALRAEVPRRDWGRSQNLSDSTVDVMWHRIRKKARKLLRKKGFEDL